jgi:hypothetical protein
MTAKSWLPPGFLTTPASVRAGKPCAADDGVLYARFMPTFSSLRIPGPLAEAIAARGYETATEVQVAVLEERC